MLRRTSEPVEFAEHHLPGRQQLAEDLLDTLEDQHGLGLSAIQIGVPLRVIAIVNGAHGPEVLWNPTICGGGAGPFVRVKEGCLSFPDVFIMVPRSSIASVTYQNEHGEARWLDLGGTAAQAIQHEIEHLDGHLLIDHTKGAQRQLVVQRLKRFMRKTRKTGKRVSL
jgi:peptide deformylase